MKLDWQTLARARPDLWENYVEMTNGRVLMTRQDFYEWAADEISTYPRELIEQRALRFL